MPLKSKQAERNSTRRSAKKGDDEPADSAGAGSNEPLLEQVKSLFVESVLVTFAPRLVNLLKPKEPGAAAKAKPTADGADGEETKPLSPEEEATDIFASLTSRLAPHNALGLSFPESGEEAKEKWLAMKGLELDWGPRKSRKGTPSLDRVLRNASDYVAQYFHLLLVLAILRAFLFRSYFAFLPLLFGLQAAAVLVPVELVPQVPLKFRAAGALGVHALLVFFFLFEVVWRMWFFEKFFVIGLLAFHAHSAKPSDAE